MSRYWPCGLLGHGRHLKGFTSTPLDKLAEAGQDRLHLQLIIHSIGAEIIAIDKHRPLKARLTRLEGIDEHLFIDLIGNAAKMRRRLTDNSKKM